jgi:hypothetical protein
MKKDIPSLFAVVAVMAAVGLSNSTAEAEEVYPPLYVLLGKLANGRHRD